MEIIQLKTQLSLNGQKQERGRMGDEISLLDWTVCKWVDPWHLNRPFTHGFISVSSIHPFISSSFHPSIHPSIHLLQLHPFQGHQRLEPICHKATYSKKPIHPHINTYGHSDGLIKVILYVFLTMERSRSDWRKFHPERLSHCVVFSLINILCSSRLS